jgi:hypothetical protein
MGWTVRGLNSGRGSTFSHKSSAKKKSGNNFMATLLEPHTSITDIFIQFNFNDRTPEKNSKANY